MMVSNLQDIVCERESNWEATANTIFVELSTLPAAHPFAVPVNPSALDIPDYFDIIRNPMDLSTISKKLQEHRYKSFSEYESDMLLMFYNARLYNTNKKSAIREMTDTCSTFFLNKVVELLPRHFLSRTVTDLVTKSTSNQHRLGCTARRRPKPSLFISNMTLSSGSEAVSASHDATHDNMINLPNFKKTISVGTVMKRNKKKVSSTHRASDNKTISAPATVIDIVENISFTCPTVSHVHVHAINEFDVTIADEEDEIADVNQSWGSGDKHAAFGTLRGSTVAQKRERIQRRKEQVGIYTHVCVCVRACMCMYVRVCDLYTNGEVL